MKTRLVGTSAVIALVAALAVASQAMAATTVPVKMSFTEQIVQDVRSGCPVIQEGLCGQGVVLPYGHATETIVFGGACGGGCDLRTVSLPGGSLYIDEFFSNPTCPGSCRPNPAEPDSGTLTDTVVGGTGLFAGATGNVSGSVTAAGPESSIRLSGTIRLTP